MSVPENQIFPVAAVTSPVIVRATVDLPAPFEPTNATMLPTGTLNETSKSAR